MAGLELERAELFRLDNPYWDDDPAVFAREYVRSMLAWGEPLMRSAFAREGQDRAPGLLDDFLRALEDRVATDPDRFRRDYIEALVICRKADGTRARQGLALGLIAGVPSRRRGRSCARYPYGVRQRGQPEGETFTETSPSRESRLIF